ncbi:MAG: asparagine synthase (glutamine-hydrolyzing) [Paludibaculum sp.]
MCAITGKHYIRRGKEVDARTLASMTDVMSYRGPNDRGLYQGRGVALGHRRLSILDLSEAGHQPMCNEDGTVWVVFNGEIYNYKALRETLESKGHLFRSHCDTEVIVHAYEEYGIDCVKHFDGMFAFGIWDERRDRLMLARDHFGIKPLYYFANSEFISFGSEIKGILADEEVPKRVDTQALSNFLTLHYVPAPRTMFEGIQKLHPGHILVAENGKISVHQFWELQKQDLGHLGERDAAELLYNQLKSSVALRMQSDVPLGTLLSGGLDSTAVLGLMTEIQGPGIPSFSVGYSNDGQDGFSEFQYSRLAAKHFQSDYHEAIVTSELFMDFLPKAAWHQDEPIGEPASVPLYYVCKKAKERGITVLLSGEGSDELLGGYNRHLGETMSSRYQMLPKPMHKAAEWLLSAMPRVPVLRKGHHAMTIPDFWQRYKSWHTVFSNDLKHQLLESGRSQAETFSDVFQQYRPADLKMNNFDKLLWLDIKTWLPDDLLMKKDRMGMATSLEARVPFLDQQFAETAFSLSSDLKVRGLSGKYVFKKSMERLLPKEIIYRKKAGFPTPISKWIAQDLRKPISEILCDTGAGDHGFFNRKLVKRLLDEHVSGRENHERLLFPILNFDLWHRAFFQRGVSDRNEVSAQPVLA